MKCCANRLFATSPMNNDSNRSTSYKL